MFHIPGCQTTDKVKSLPSGKRQIASKIHILNSKVIEGFYILKKELKQ